MMGWENRMCLKKKTSINHKFWFQSKTPIQKKEQVLFLSFQQVTQNVGTSFPSFLVLFIYLYVIFHV